MTQAHDRDRWITQDDDRLLSECKVDAYRASGPGGQKRNKTSSAVRLRHGPSGLIAGGEESRSQHENKARALRRLRMIIALEVREAAGPTWKPPDVLTDHLGPSGRLEVSRRHADYPLIVAAVLDVLAACGGGLRDAAARLSLTTGQLSKFIVADGKLLAAANRVRQAAGLHPMTVTR